MQHKCMHKHIADIDQSKALYISVQHAMCKLSRAWNCVTTNRITHCLIHAGFSTDNAAPTFNDDEDFDVEDDIRLS